MASTTSRLRKQLAKNLDKQVKNNNAPQKIIGTEFIDILLDLLLSLFENCLGQNNKETVAGRVSKPNVFQQSALRRKIRKGVYKNSRRKYNKGGGKNVYDAVLQTAKDASDEDADDLIEEVDNEGLVDYKMF